MGRLRNTRSTKVVATIGPACDTTEAIGELIAAGLNVARLNFSHGTHEQHALLASRIREAAALQQAHIAIMCDTKGPEIRTGALTKASVNLKDGAAFSLYTEDRKGDKSGVSVTHEGLPSEVEIGRSIFLDDGSIQLVVESVGAGRVDCRVLRGGELGERKGVTIPGADLSLPTLGPADLEDLRFAAEQGFDYVAASFVRSPSDITRIREVVADAGGEIPVIAKIEHPRAVENLEAIIEAADGTMVARGDLGVEMPVEQVPIVQKRIIRATVHAGKPVITATQMLDSMERRPHPTRAEASDVANAILDGSSAVMLSGETAKGDHPVAALRMMARIAREAEQSLAEFGALQRNPEPMKQRVTDAVADAACGIANNAGAAAILTLTETGHTSRAISKHRPGCPIFAVTSSDAVARRLALNWGVTGLLYTGASDGSEEADEAKIEFGLAQIRDNFGERGDPVVITAGISRATGSTNLVRVVRL